MNILDDIRLLYCLNEAGVDKAHEVLEKLLNNVEYLHVTPEQLRQELEKQRQQDELVWQIREEEERARKEKKEAEILALKKKYQQEFKMIGWQNAFHKQYDILEALEKTVKGSVLWKLVHAFNWGYIQGIRAERFKRKRVSQ